MPTMHDTNLSGIMLHNNNFQSMNSKSFYIGSMFYINE